MPDWFYRTVSQPALFRIPAKVARDFSLSFMQRLSQLPFSIGTTTIELLGHMHPDPQLKSRLGNSDVQSSVGLGCGLDPSGKAFRAWQQFGFGYIEVGPVSSSSPQSDEAVGRNVDEQTITLPSKFSVPIDEIRRNLEPLTSSKCEVIIRLRPKAQQITNAVISELNDAVTELKEIAHCFSIDLSSYWSLWTTKDWEQIWEQIFSKVGFTFILCIPINQPIHENLKSLIENSSEPKVAFLIDGEIPQDGKRLLGSPALEPTLNTLKAFRKQIGNNPIVLVSGGIHQPAEARTMLEAGANFIQIDTGLIFSGPGLCKRINEAILFDKTKDAVKSISDGSIARQSWFWTALLGVAMLLGSIIALWIAATEVVLPYDLEFCGLTREQLQALNPNLLPFMSHDRVTLAGSMIALGIMYLGLSLKASRYGDSWAKTAILSSAGVGFFSFFLFLGFGYFDPFHGFVTAVLFQLFALGLYAKLSPKRKVHSVDWAESREWKRAQWGQLLMIIHSIGLLFAGVIICFIGVQDVFVSTDLDFLGTTREILMAANSNIIPLVAHDRATLGGMLVSSGIVYLLTMLWGIGRGMRWLWHTLWWSGLSAYVAAIGVHYAVGYTAWFHLFPAFLGLIILCVGMGLLFPWMQIKERT